MTPGGWIFMTVSWAILTALMVYSYCKVLGKHEKPGRTRQKEKK